jgi:hypothetical protein
MGHAGAVVLHLDGTCEGVHDPLRRRPRGVV